MEVLKEDAKLQILLQIAKQKIEDAVDELHRCIQELEHKNVWQSKCDKNIKLKYQVQILGFKLKFSKVQRCYQLNISKVQSVLQTEYKGRANSKFQKCKGRGNSRIQMYQILKISKVQSC